MTSGFNIIIHTKFDDELEKIWRSFDDQGACYFFQTYDWIDHWYQTLGRPLLSIKPLVVTVYSQTNIVALLPFGVRRIVGFRILEWLGGNQTDYMTGIFSLERDWAEKEIQEIWGLIEGKLRNIDVVHLKRQPYYVLHSNIDVDKNGRIVNPFFRLRAIRKKSNSFSLILTHPKDDFTMSLISGEVRRDTKRKIRRLSEKGSVCLVCATDEKKHKEIVQEMIRQKRRRFMDTGQQDLLSDKSEREFYLSCPERLGSRGNVHCSALYVGDKLVAAHWGVVSDNRFYWLMPSFESGPWGRYSPGRVLLFFLIDWAINKRLYEFDLTIGDDLYKRKWTNTTMPLFEDLIPITPWGNIYMLYQKVKVYRPIKILLKIGRVVGK